MSSVQTIEVHTAPAYEVTIGAGLLRDCGARLKAVLGGCRHRGRRRQQCGSALS